MRHEILHGTTSDQGADRVSPAPRLLWLDRTRNGSESALFAQAAEARGALRLTDWQAVPNPGRGGASFVLCAEFGCPLPSDLEPLGEITTRSPALPVVMLTEGHSEALVIQALRMRVWDYLVKPVTWDELDCRITTLLERRRPEREPAADPIRLGPEPVRERRTDPAIGYVAANFHDRVDLATAARRCHMSPSHFSRVFKAERGVTFSRYLVEFRIRRACDLLADSGKTVKEVGFGVGFNDLAYFSRTFRRCVGVCPTQYQSAATAS